MRTPSGKRWIVAGLAVGGLVVVAGSVLFAFRDRATPVSEEEVAASVVTGGGRPGDPGIYDYATLGYETTDALAGARHEYPAQTIMTIQPGGCHTLVRWRALQERWEEWDYCEDGRLAGWRSYHQWFGISNLDEWVCAEPLLIQGEPGETRMGRCAKGDSEEAGAAEQVSAYEVVGYETLDVGGEPVEALHVRRTKAITGGTEGSGTAELWFAPGTGLLVRLEETYQSFTASRIGRVEYVEQVELSLLSLRPRS